MSAMRVPTERVRNLFLASGATTGDVAKRLGWWVYRSDGSQDPDYSRLKRTLGLQDELTRGKRYRRQTIDIEIAEQIAEACGHAGWEIEEAA